MGIGAADPSEICDRHGEGCHRLQVWTPPPPALRAQGLVKSFRSTRAVDGVDRVVRPGERVALLGPNGAGKTTTLLMALGTITPDEGSVELFGHRLPKARSRAMEHVGFAAGYLPLPDRTASHGGSPAGNGTRHWNSASAGQPPERSTTAMSTARSSAKRASSAPSKARSASGARRVA